LNDSPKNSPVSAYLHDLDAQLVRVPEPVASQVREGIAEELHSLSPAVARQRMEQLGDPARIANEARRDSAVIEESLSPGLHLHAYIVVTASLIAVGGILVPVLGWVAGIVMLWLSHAWRPLEKIIATVTPLLFISVALVWQYVAVTPPLPSVSNSPGDQGFHAPTMSDFAGITPLLPPTWLFVALCVLNVAIAVWILRRGLIRSSR